MTLCDVERLSARIRTSLERIGTDVSRSDQLVMARIVKGLQRLPHAIRSTFGAGDLAAKIRTHAKYRDEAATLEALVRNVVSTTAATYAHVNEDWDDSALPI